ncbi:MAG TPA: Ni/Fe hydrogenase subunit alpha [Conexivisphaerales archaeon]|nr:Ni/Fe hydrogenase subunit alpha [Conexivisphaerales archaeon]
MKRVVINPATRLEGHAKIAIIMDENGEVQDALFQTVEFKGFEGFCLGRNAEELPVITSRICGVCPWAHHMASVKATDALFSAQPPPTALKVRELAYDAFMVHDHSAVFYALAAPDLLLDPDTPRAQRNILELVRRIGRDTGAKVLTLRKAASEILTIAGGRATHPIFGCPGGITRGLTREDIAAIRERSRQLVELAELTNKVFEDSVASKKEFIDLFNTEAFVNRSYYASLVGKDGRVSLLDGDVRVIRPDGSTFEEFRPSEYLDHFKEASLPWTYMKFPYLQNVGWRGLQEGNDSGVYRVGPLARFNVTKGFTTPKAQEKFELFRKTLGSPAHQTLAYQWARVIEILYAAERVSELVDDPELGGTETRAPIGKPGEGIGVVEAPRGLLIHHYKADDKGLVTFVNLIVPSTHNNSGICLSVKKAAKSLIRGTQVPEPVFNRVEMLYRAYDPCLACGTHALPGALPLKFELYDSSGKLLRTESRGI